MIERLNQLAHEYAFVYDNYIILGSGRWIYLDEQLRASRVSAPSVWSFWYRPSFWVYVWRRWHRDQD